MVTNQSVRRSGIVRRGLFCVIAIIPFLGFTSHVALAQSGTVWSPKYARPGQPVSIFAEWASGLTFDAVRIRLPKGWNLVTVENVDDARMNRSVMKLRPDGKAWIAEARFRLASPVRLIVTALPDDEEEEASVSVEPGNLIPTKKGVTFESAGESVRTTVPVEDRHVTGGHALNLEFARRLFSAPDLAPPVFPAGKSFSVEFWFQTVQRDAVLLSTWDGNETGSYPVEFVIDAGGNLRCYSGQAGRHLSLLSSHPVADGAWHHVAYVRDVDASSASLYVDGRSDDSVYLYDRSGVASYPIAIGGRVGAETSGTSGLLDELRIWATARRAETIVSEAHLPGRSLAVKPIVLEDFESLPASLEADDDILAASDLALHQPVRDAKVEVKSGAVEIGWRLTSGEAQTVTLERSEDGSLFVPIYLVVAGARDREVSELDRAYSFTDVDVDGSSVFYYRFTQNFQDGSRLVSNTLKVGLGDSEAPQSFKLIGNSPNPFVHSTQVFFELSETMHVRLSVWDISGHMVEWLVNATLEPGRHMVAFSADDLPSGTYFVRLESRDGVTTRKMILRK